MTLIVHTPDSDAVAASRLADYLGWLDVRGQAPTTDARDYAALHAWSVADIERFWRSIWEYTGLISAGAPGPVSGALPLRG